MFIFQGTDGSMETECEERKTHKNKTQGENGMIILIAIYVVLQLIYNALMQMFEELY